MDVLFARNQKKTLVEPVTCTCPYRADCWLGDVCGTRQTITDRPGCFRPLDGSAPVVAKRPPIRPVPPMTESAEEPEDDEEDAPSPVTPQKAVMIQGVLF